MSKAVDVQIISCNEPRSRWVEVRGLVVEGGGRDRERERAEEGVIYQNCVLKDHL
jgi:hypothetical protein